jgi:hypothetical protein
MDAVSLNRYVDLDAADLLAAVDATRKSARRRATGATVDDHGAGFRGIAAGAPPSAAQAVERLMPKAEPSLAFSSIPMLVIVA